MKFPRNSSLTMKQLLSRSYLVLGLLIIVLVCPAQSQYEDDDNGYEDDDNGYEDDDNGYEDDDNGYEDDDNGYTDYEAETEATDPDYNVDYGDGGSGEIETNTNTTMNCSSCFNPRPVFCNWSSGSGLRFPSFIRHYQPPTRIISFGPWGSLTNRYISWGRPNRWGATGSGRWQGRGGSGWSGNFGNRWQTNSWLSGNSCLWAGGIGCGGGVGGVQVEMVPPPGTSGCAGAGGMSSTCSGCSSCGSSNNLLGWMGRFTNQKQTGRRQNSNNYWSNSNIRWGQSGGGGGRGGGGGGGRGRGRGGFGGLNLSRFTNQWSSIGGQRQRQQNSWNNRWGAMRMGSGSNWSGSSILSWFG